MLQFKTLMAREWMQQHRSWLWLGFYAPLVAWGLLYLVLSFARIPEAAMTEVHGLLGLAHAGVSLLAAGIGAICLAAVLFTVPGLPHRDLDDRSLAFWRALPTSDAQAVLAALLMNILLLPLMALGLSLGMSVLLVLCATLDQVDLGVRGAQVKHFMSFFALWRYPLWMPAGSFLHWVHIPLLGGW